MNLSFTETGEILVNEGRGVAKLDRTLDPNPRASEAEKENELEQSRFYSFQHYKHFIHGNTSNRKLTHT